MKKNILSGLTWLAFVCIPHVGTFAQDQIVIPHLPRDTNNFKVDLVLENHLDQTRYLAIEGFGTAGNGLGVVAVEVPPNKRVLLDPKNYFKDESAVWLIITGRAIGEEALSQDTMTGLVAGVSLELAGNPDSATFVEGIRQPARKWRIHTGNWQETFDGLAIVNTDRCAGTSVRLYHHSAEGSLLKMVDISPTRGGFHKLLVNLSGVLDPVPGSYVDIEADVSMAITGLRGSLNLDAANSYLVGNLAMAFPNFEKERRILEENRDKWRKAGVGGSYIFDLHFLCFCTENLGRDVSLRVMDGWIESYDYADQNGEVPIDSRSMYRTVDGLFDLIEKAMDDEYFGVVVTYDEQFGYPLDISLDNNSCTVDEELVLRASNLVPIK